MHLFFASLFFSAAITNTRGERRKIEMQMGLNRLMQKYVLKHDAIHLNNAGFDGSRNVGDIFYPSKRANKNSLTSHILFYL